MSQHVPSCLELSQMSPPLAREVFTTIGSGRKQRTDKRWDVSPEGYALLGRIMRENALEARSLGVGDWVQPPSSGKERHEHLDTPPAPARKEVRPLPASDEGAIRPATSWGEAPVPLSAARDRRS